MGDRASASPLFAELSWMHVLWQLEIKDIHLPHFFDDAYRGLDMLNFLGICENNRPGLRDGGVSGTRLDLLKLDANIQHSIHQLPS